MYFWVWSGLEQDLVVPEQQDLVVLEQQDLVVPEQQGLVVLERLGRVVGRLGCAWREATPSDAPTTLWDELVGRG